MIEQDEVDYLNEEYLQDQIQVIDPKKSEFIQDTSQLMIEPDDVELSSPYLREITQEQELFIEYIKDENQVTQDLEIVDKETQGFLTSYVYFSDAISLLDYTTQPIESLQLMQGKKQRLVFNLTNRDPDQQIALNAITACFEGPKTVELPAITFDKFQLPARTPRPNILFGYQSKTFAYEFWVFSDMHPNDQYQVKFKLDFQRYNYQTHAKINEESVLYQQSFSVVEREYHIELSNYYFIYAILAFVLVYLATSSSTRKEKSI